ncbi:DUF58 domain-containing protein [Oligoflexaceae bacterium]|nr:DUF58 domain-containing protein [Oligoflexaceae bacterium]
MLSRELIEQIRGLQLRAGRVVTEALSGEYHSAFKGQGIEFDELREYTPGDDIRSIDWKVTARMGQAFVKVFREEREQTLMLIIDVSASQDYTSHYRLKKEVAAEMAAILAYLATTNNDRVGLIIFSDHVEKFIPPKKGRSHIWNIIRTVLTFEPEGTKTNIKAALDFFQSITPKKSICFVISDFITDHFQEAMARTARKHELVAISIIDPGEVKPEPIGLIEIEGIEDQQRRNIFLKDSKETERSKLQRRWQKDWLRSGIQSFTLRTDQDTVEPLKAFIARKERRR